MLLLRNRSNFKTKDYDLNTNITVNIRFDSIDRLNPIFIKIVIRIFQNESMQSQTVTN